MILVFPDGRIGGSTYSDSEWANTPAGSYESLRPERRARRRPALRHAAQPARARDRRVLRRCLRRHQRPAAQSRHLRQSRVLVRVLPPAPDRGVRSRAAGRPRRQQPARYVATCTASAADPVRAFMFVGRDDDVSPQLGRWRGRWPRPAPSSATRFTPAATTGSCGTRTSTRCCARSRDTVAPQRHRPAQLGPLTPGVVPIPMARAASPPCTARGAPPRAVRQRQRTMPGAFSRDRRPAAGAHVGRRDQHRLPAPAPRPAPQSPAGGPGRAAARGHPRSLVDRWSGARDGWASSPRSSRSPSLHWRSCRRLPPAGLALSVPLAAVIFRHRIGRRRWSRCTSSPPGWRCCRSASPPPRITSVRVPDRGGLREAHWPASRAGARLGTAWGAAMAAGAFYGVADAAIKAVSLTGAATAPRRCFPAGRRRRGRDVRRIPRLPVRAAGRPPRGRGLADECLCRARRAGCGLEAFGESLGAGAASRSPTCSRSRSSSAAFRCWPLRRPRSSNPLTSDSTDRRGGPRRSPRSSDRGNAQPTANAAASSTGPRPGVRENSTSVNLRLRASANDACDASSSATKPAISASAARRCRGVCTSAIPVSAPASPHATSTRSSGWPSNDAS